MVVALAAVTGGRLEGGPGSVADGEEKVEVSGDGRLGFCDKELLRLLLKIRGKGGGCPGLVLKERELSLVAGC